MALVLLSRAIHDAVADDRPNDHRLAALRQAMVDWARAPLLSRQA